MIETVCGSEAVSCMHAFGWFKRYSGMWGCWRWCKEWAAVDCLKYGNSCQSSWTGGQRLLTLKFMELHLKV